jgi:cob(I)alamin adenosyltransferase
MALLTTLGKQLAVRGSSLVIRKSSSSSSFSRFASSSVSIIMTEQVVDIEDLHQHAIKQGSSTYIDPKTGFQVFTELPHLKRGFCCGNQCRHCPYGYESVGNGTRRPAKLKSGDKNTAEQMVKAILQKQQRPLTTTTTTTKNVPYTRKGDGGTSQLGTGERRSKTDTTFEAMGTVDELCTFVGVVHAHLNVDEDDYGNLSSQLLDVMSRLFDIGSHIARPRATTTGDGGEEEVEAFQANGIGGGFDPNHIDDLEVWINQMTDELPELTSFILPTGAKAAAHLHVARTVCRRAERSVVPLVMDNLTCDPNALKYLNRLSDYFFVAARWVNFVEGLDEIQYQRESPNTTQRQRVTRSLQETKQETKLE